MSSHERRRSSVLLDDFAGRNLHQRFVVAIGGVTFVVVAVMAFAADFWLRGVTAGMPSEEIADARVGVLLGAAMLLSLLLVGLAAVNRFVLRSVSAPALRLAALSERVAAGDLTVTVPHTNVEDEMGRLSRATEGMLAELRRLVSAIDQSARRSSMMSAEITAGTEQMTSAAAEIAQTSNDLSAQSTAMAGTVQAGVADAAALRRIASQLSAGARGGVERNVKLRDLARESRGRLDASSVAFDRLVAEAQLGASAADALAEASEEIRAFLTLVRKMARQSRLLALNASMEAARAGEAGDGFAAVATEIRKMAAGAAEAAERTQRVVDEVLARVEETRESSRRTMGTVSDARRATTDVRDAFAQVEAMVGEMDRWTGMIDGAASESAAVVNTTTQRLDELARGIEGFAAAMEEVAAAAQEQSASTQEIATAAAALSSSSRELQQLVTAFHVGKAA